MDASSPMANPVRLCFLALLTAVLCRGGESAAPSPIPPGCFSKIYAFGDSFTDTGNTRSPTGPSFFRGVSTPPYGETYFHRPTNRYSDGRLVVDFVAQALGLPLLQPYLRRGGDFSHGVNFAVAGSTALEHEFFTQRNITVDQTPQSLDTQLQWFLQFLGAQCNDSLKPNACKRDSAQGEPLYWIGEIGANDYAYTAGSGIPTQTVRALAVAKTVKFLEALIGRGARYILVQGLPLTGCLPLTMAFGSPDGRDRFGCVRSANGAAESHNSLLQKQLEVLRRKYPNALIVYADYAAAHGQVLQSPREYGFEYTRRACCGAGGGEYNFDVFATCGGGSGGGGGGGSVISDEKSTACEDPRKYVNWDGVHFTDAVNGVFAKMFLQGGFTRPAFAKLLLQKGCLRP